MVPFSKSLSIILLSVKLYSKKPISTIHKLNLDHRSLITGHYRSIWSTMSDSTLQNTHLSHFLIPIL